MSLNSSKDKKIVEEEEGEVLFESVDLSFLSPNFYNIDKESFLNYKSVHERLTTGYINFDLIKDEKKFFEKVVAYATRMSYTLFNYLTGEKEYNVIFNPNSNHSYCGLTKNIVHIGMSILTQKNIPRELRADVVIALVFHEFYHKKWTIADLKKIIKLEPFYDHPEIEKAIKAIFPTKLQGVINNILEDRREEKLGAEEFPGFSFYFERLREYSAFLHASKKFKPSFAEAIIIDFLLVKVLLPELMPKFQSEIERYRESFNELKSEFFITPEAQKKFIEDLENVVKTIKEINTHIDLNRDQVFSDYFSDILIQTNEIYSLIPKELQNNLETKLGSGEVIYINITEKLGGENLNEGQREKLSEELEKFLQKVVSDEIKKIEQEEKDAESAKNDKKIIQNEKVISRNNFTDYTIIQMITEPIKAFDHKLFQEASAISKQICKQLGFLDSRATNIIEEYELTEGDLDEDELHGIMYNRYIFEDIDQIPQYSLDFGILLDESGSMSGKIEEAKKATLALCLGLKDAKHINLFVYGHTANNSREGNGNAIQMYKYYNTVQQFTDWRRIFSASSRSNNADGYAIEKMADIMAESPSKQKILCVVSDGQPAANGYGGNLGEQHVRLVNTQLKAKGITVIQICMNFIENSPRMFDEFVPYDEDGKFFDNLKTILMRELIQIADSI